MIQQCTLRVAAGRFPAATPSLATRAARGVFLVVAIAALQLGFLALDTWRLERERASLEAQRESIFRAAFPEARSSLTPTCR